MSCRFQVVTPVSRGPAHSRWRGETGEAHEPETHLIPLVLAAARSGRTVRIYGDDYDTADGSCVRDYIHVCDIADAHVRALDHLLNGGASCALNLANARGYSVKEVLAAAESVCGRRIPSKIAARHPGDPPILIGEPPVLTRSLAGDRNVPNWRYRLRTRGSG